MREPPMQSVPAGRCVLLVDDEPSIRTTLSYVLADAGISVLIAESGVKGLDMLSKHRDTIDVVLLDRAMPGGPGESFVPRLRAISSRARILFLSGQPVDPGLAALVDGVVPKPVTGPVLLDAIQRALGCALG
jgi:DNA-binding response OmpR family regulator